MSVTSLAGTSLVIGSAAPMPVMFSSGIAIGAGAAAIAGRVRRAVFFRAGEVAAFRPIVRPAIFRPDDFVVDFRAPDERALIERDDDRDLLPLDFRDELAPFFFAELFDDRPDDFFDVDFFAMWLLDG